MPRILARVQRLSTGTVLYALGSPATYEELEIGIEILALSKKGDTGRIPFDEGIDRVAKFEQLKKGLKETSPSQPTPAEARLINMVATRVRDMIGALLTDSEYAVLLRKIRKWARES